MRLPLLLLSFVVAAPAFAQFETNPRSQLKQPRKGPEPIKGAGDEVRVRADKSGGEKDHGWWEGFVDLQSGDIRVQADKLRYDETDNPDGTKSRLFEAEGNVVFMRVDERLAGDHMKMDLESNLLIIENASGYVQPGVFVEAKKIERIDDDTYRVEGATFTSCAQPNPRWGFTASEATIEVGDKIKGKNVFFKVKSVPALYIPYFAFPIHEDQRSSGILFPHFGFSNVRGFNLGTGFFWAIGRSLDNTFVVDRYSKIGNGVGQEFRYVRDMPSRGYFKSYWFNPEKGKFNEYDLDWNMLQALPGKFRLSGNVRKYSSINFQQQYQDNFNLATNRTQRSTATISGTLGRNGPQLQLTADSTDTFFGTYPQINRRLPSLRVVRYAKKIGHSQYIFGYEARTEYLGRSNDEILDYWGRVDIAPELSRSFSTSFLQVTPRLRPRYTYYSGTLDDVGLTTLPARSRPFFEGGLEVRGPQFSRVFGGPGFYTEKIKHVVGPEITWTYRSHVSEFDKIPKYDGYDQVLGTNQIDYALVQQLYAKRPSGAAGKLTPYQFLTWRLQQSYYVQISDNQQEYDPNYSSVYYAPGGFPTHVSPLSSRFRVRPGPDYSINFDAEYDVKFKQTRSLSLYGNAQNSWLTVNAGWFRAKQVAQKVVNRRITRDTIRVQGGLRLPFHFTLEGMTDYDFIQKKALQTSTRLRMAAQCCGFTLELIEFDYNSRKEKQFRFSIQLANLGSIGNNMGQDANVRQGLYGFR